MELEEGDEAALPEGSSLFERVPPSEAPRRVVKGEAPTAAAAAGAGAGPGKAKADSEVWYLVIVIVQYLGVYLILKYIFKA